MGISTTLSGYLQQHGVGYELIRHAHSACSSETAQSAHVPGDQLAKGVVLRDTHGLLMAVVPSTHYVELGKLRRFVQRDALEFAGEETLSGVFKDCELGALPPIGEAFGLDVAVDDALIGYPDIYFEGGNHDDVVRISGADFRRLTRDAIHGYFSRRMTH
jgi:Ala-tRNA(Pro) deacylase